MSLGLRLLPTKTAYYSQQDWTQREMFWIWQTSIDFYHQKWRNLGIFLNTCSSTSDAAGNSQQKLMKHSMANWIWLLKILQRLDMKLLISTTDMPRLEIRLKEFQSYPIKVIVNSAEWEITLHLHEFRQSWMRYALGRGSDMKNLSILYP